MKTPILPLLLTLIGTAAAEPKAQPAATEANSPAIVPAEPAAAATVPKKLRFKGKTGAPTTCTVTATRSGNQSKIRLVTLAPGDEGVTCKSLPRLWWYQSEATGLRELEFILSSMDVLKPEVLLRRPLPPMARGFNVIDFSNTGFNRTGLALKPGGLYQWTIRLVDKSSAPQVYCRMKVTGDASPSPVADLQDLSENGNWYELFDAVSSASAGPGPDAKEMSAIREQLLEQIGLGSAVK